MVEWASLMRTSSAPPSRKPRTAAFTSEVNIDRQRSHSGVPGSTSAGQVTPVAPSMSALMRIFTMLQLYRSREAPHRAGRSAGRTG